MDKDEMKAAPEEGWRRIWVFAFFVIVAVFLTWPLLADLYRSLYGNVGDPVNVAWSLRWFRETALSGQAGAFHYPHAGYPQGINGYLPLPILYMPLALLTYLPRGEVITYNLIILVSVALNGFVMFLLGEKVFKNRYVALITGLAYMFCPYALTRARYHVSLVEIFVFPLILYALLKLKEDFSTRNKWIAFVSLLLVLSVHPYYSFMVVFMLALLLVYFVARSARRGRLKEHLHYIRSCLLLAAVALVITAALTYVQLLASNDSLAAFSRREGDLYTYAAHAWNYLVPSTHSSFFGDAARQLLAGRQLGMNIEEYVLFLGFMNMGLALIASALWVLRRFSRAAGEFTRDVREHADWVVPFSALLGITAFLFSLQPTMEFRGVTLYFPTWFFYKVIPFIRVYSRFGVLVFFAVTLISGACLSFLARAVKARGRPIGSVVMALVAVLMLSEFVEFGGKPMQDLYEPEAMYGDVRDLPEGTVIVEYPFVASDESFNSLFLWNQFHHRRSMLNGYPLGSEGEVMRLGVMDLLGEETPSLLAYMGADYVKVNRDMYLSGSEYSYGGGEIDLEALPPGYEVVGEDADSALLAIAAERPETVVRYDVKCSLAHLPDGSPGLWLQFGQEWEIKIDAARDMVVDVDFDICSVGGERDFRLIDASGEGRSATIGAGAVTISLRGVALREGMNFFHLSTSAEQVAYNEVYGGHDNKKVSFVMSFWEVREASGGPLSSLLPRPSSHGRPTGPRPARSRQLKWSGSCSPGRSERCA